MKTSFTSLRKRLTTIIITTVADVLNEALNQARIEETGLNIPKVLEVTMIDGKWAIISEYIKGKTLAHLMAEDEENKAKYKEFRRKAQARVIELMTPGK